MAEQRVRIIGAAACGQQADERLQPGGRLRLIWCGGAAGANHWCCNLWATTKRVKAYRGGRLRCLGATSIFMLGMLHKDA